MSKAALSILIEMLKAEAKNTSAQSKQNHKPKNKHTLPIFCLKPSFSCINSCCLCTSAQLSAVDSTWNMMSCDSLFVAQADTEIRTDYHMNMSNTEVCHRTQQEIK